MRTNSTSFLIVVLAGAICLIATTRVAAQGKIVTSPGTMREPDLPAPNLFADKLTLKASLLDLPGASDPKSTWELTYAVYFIPEREYYSLLDRLPPGQHNLEVEKFSRKILLAQGRVNKTSLASPQERREIKDIVFKTRVPEKDKTKFARLLTSYSVKIYDAHLKIPLYHSGVFVTNVFEKGADRSQAAPKNSLYLNFTVLPNGNLSYTQWPTQ
jgi:hypothetical protein